MRSLPWKLMMLYLSLLFTTITAKLTTNEDFTCPPDYQRVTEEKLCYKLFRDQVLWHEAFDICSEKNSYLLQLQNKNTTLNMISLFANYDNIKFVWIGLKRLNHYFQWVGTNPQLLRSDENQGSLQWAKSEPRVWDGCGAIEFKTGQLYSKACDKKKLPFICVKPFNEYIPETKFNLEIPDIEAFKDKVDVRVVPINITDGSILTNDSILWIDEKDLHFIFLECQVRINDILMTIENPDSNIKIIWRKNGIYRSAPTSSVLNPQIWLHPTPWKMFIGHIKFSLGTYSCLASKNFESHRYDSNDISIFLKGTIIFKYEIGMELDNPIALDCIEPTSSKTVRKWKNEISNMIRTILPLTKPHNVDATRIDWMLHYLEPQTMFEDDANSTKYIQISLFVAVETQSIDDDEIKRKLLKMAQFEETEIETIGKCKVDNEKHYRWSMKLGQSRGFSDPICVKSKPKYRMITRKCKATYHRGNQWDNFDYLQCTSKITHLFEDHFCPKGHKMVNDDFCAVNGSTNKTWADARDECIRKGSHLPHNAFDIYATDQIPASSWSVARLNGRRVYPGPPQNFSGQKWTECVVLNRTSSPIWQGAVCSEKHSFACLTRIQDTLWRVPWCPRGGWLGSEIPELRNSCFFINTSLILPEPMKTVYCNKRGARIVNSSNPLIYTLIMATVRDQDKVLSRRKRSVRYNDLMDIPFVACQKPKAARSPRKAKLVLTHSRKGFIDKYPMPNSRIVWYQNGDPYPELERIGSDEKDYLAAAQVELNETKQGDYWCEAWDNNAQSTVTSNKITLIVPGVNNCVIVLNTTNSSIQYDFEVNKISYYFNKADSNIVRREVTLLADGQMVIWVRGNSHHSQEELISDVRSQFEAHLKADKLILPPITVRSTQWCLQETTTNNGKTLIWPQTKRNHATLPKELCFTNDGNPVSRECIGDFRQGAYWGPVIDSCTGQANEFTTSLYKLSESEVTSDNAFDKSELLDGITDAKPIIDYRPVDIAYIAKTMQKISDTGNVTNETLKKIVDTVNRVMYIDSDKILSSHEFSRSSNRITQTLEKMIDSVPLEQGHPLQFSLPNIYVEAHLLGPEPNDTIVGIVSFHQKQISLSSANQLNYNLTDNALLLPESLIRERKEMSGNGGLKLYFVMYHNSKLFTANNATVNSKVIAASLPDHSVHNYESPITLVFEPLQKMSMESISCTYWDPRLNSGKGEWSTAGCWLVPRESNQGNKIICQCNHLTNFAVLMDIYGQDEPIDETHKHILDIITYIGCALSILGLTMTILTFLLFNKWRKKDSNRILFNLALSLLFVLITFLAGIEQTDSPIVCQAVAILLHYFILASFCWMLVEAIQQYLLFVRIFATYIPRFLLKAMLFAWGLPLIIVVIVIGIDIKQYSGGDHHCWMKKDALYFAFLLPVGIIIIINAVVFILVLRGIFCSRKSNLRSNQSKQQLMKTQLFAAICIFVLLGLTWVFGFLAIEDARTTFQYIFCICNSLQGLLIFVFMVVRDRNAHDLWSSLCAAKKTPRLGTTSGLQTMTRREEANMSENFTTKLMISRSSTHSPP